MVYERERKRRIGHRAHHPGVRPEEGGDIPRRNTGRNGDIQRLPEGQQELPLNNGECFLQYLSGKEIIQHTGSPPGR